MRGVEAAAARAYALDVGAGRAGPSGAPTLVASKPAAPPPKKPSNPYANYTTAEFLGYTDPDAERLQAELERRRTQGVVGDWETLPTTTRIPTPPISAPDIDVDTKPSLNATNTVSIGMKREAAVAAVAADDEDGRAWKLRKKTATLGDIYDPGVIPIKIRTRTKAEEESVDVAAANTGGGDEIVSANEDTKQGENTTAAALKLEPTPVKLENTSSQTITSDTVGGSLFKKRKAPSGAGQGRRAQF
jgi:WW domain-binding protein 4